jgi:electron transfer flavoprotein beta subunit
MLGYTPEIAGGPNPRQETVKIAVCVKQVVTREFQVRVNADGTWIRDTEASWGLNEPDAYALEEALRLKDAHGAEVLAVSAGPDRVTHVLREALARGADRAIHVQGEWLTTAEAPATAAALAHALRDEAADLLLTGLQSDDQGFAEVGVVLAEALGLPHATIVVAVDVAGTTLRVKRELEGGWFQWIAMPLPALLTLQSGINQLRYATLKGIMAAKKKDLRVIAAPAPPPARQRIRSVHAPVRTKQTRLISGAPTEAAVELVRALRDDARAIARSGQDR